MRSWEFENGCEVEETEFDYDLHEFAVYYKGKKCTVTPGSIEDMERCIAKLDAGEDPVTGEWEDGAGNDVGWMLKSSSVKDIIEKIVTEYEPNGGETHPEGDTYQYEINGKIWNIFTESCTPDDYAEDEEIIRTAYALHDQKRHLKYDLDERIEDSEVF